MKDLSMIREQRTASNCIVESYWGVFGGRGGITTAKGFGWSAPAILMNEHVNLNTQIAQHKPAFRAASASNGLKAGDEIGFLLGGSGGTGVLVADGYSACKGQ